ncbi:Transcriptional regulator, IclR family [Olavius sp. associated proteobacterium Delta 1]|nr:Transcriptional regulator, IclR family [Olavius sp. associated proteobacterium Delta 1]
MTHKSVEKAIAVLNCFSTEKQILGVGEVSRYTGYTKSTVSRLLSTLEKHGCVTRTKNLGKYQLGYRIQLWANMGARQNNLVNIARPIMEKLRDKCGEEIALYVIEGDRRVCVDRVESLHEIAKVGPVGTFYPLHAGASGKVLLAYLPADKRNAIIRKGRLEKYTSLTITDTKKLEKDLKAIRKKGYAVSRGEREPDAFSVTAPVWDASGRVVASISISGPNFRLTDKQLKKNIQEILAASKEVSNKLGYVGN